MYNAIKVVSLPSGTQRYGAMERADAITYDAPTAEFSSLFVIAFGTAQAYRIAMLELVHSEAIAN